MQLLDSVESSEETGCAEKEQKSIQCFPYLDATICTPSDTATITSTPLLALVSGALQMHGTTNMQPHRHLTTNRCRTMQKGTFYNEKQKQDIH